MSLCPIFAFVHRWCAEGGKLICCDYCNNAFCKKCILRNLGRKELSIITDENSKWHCYVCRSDPLQELVNKCHRIMEKLEQDQKTKQRKSEKSEESKRHKSKSVKEHKAVVNGKEHSEGSGTMTFSYKKLQVPKELIKKAKKLVETTTGLNHTFIQFIQQGAGEQGQGSIRYRHLKAFKAVLSDLQKAHTTLEEALEHEFKNVDVQNGNEEHLAEAMTAAENDHMEEEEEDEEDGGGGDADDGRPLEHDMDDEEEADDNNETGINSDSASKDALDGKDSQSETDSPKKVVKTEPCDDGLLSGGETSLDQDIMSVPPSVPEELFQMVESLADSTMLAQADSNATADSEKDSESVKSNGDVVDKKKPKAKVKNLIVKLTPVPVVTTSGKKSRSKNKDGGDTPKKPKEEQDKEKNSNPPPTRRSSRVKTTPLRKQAEKKVCKDETSDSELEQDGKTEKSSNREEDQAEDSDSDEVPAILKEKAAEAQSSDNEQEQDKASTKKRLFKANNTPEGDKDSKRKKRKPESSDSELESKTAKASKKRRQKKTTEPSSSDSDQEKAAKGKASAAKRRSSSKKKEEDKNSPESRPVESKRSYKRKSKRRSSKQSSKLQSSSSSSSSSQDEEEQQDDGGDSGDEHDVQKMKPNMEESVIGADVGFRQSSGEFVCDLGVCSFTLIRISLAFYIQSVSHFFCLRNFHLTRPAHHFRAFSEMHCAQV